MKLEVLPGRKGDCMLLHLGEVAEQKLVLIDGGPSGVWGDALEDRLLKLRDERGPDSKLLIDLVIVSHVDDDHINGILRLLEAVEDRDFPVEIGELWHNSFDRILGNVQIPAANRGAILASLEGDAASDTESDDHDKRSAALVLASIAQGDRLLRQAKRMNIPVNRTFEGELIIARQPAETMNVLGTEITVEGPLCADVEELQRVFDEWLSDHIDQVDTASLLAALTDISAANLSSIVLSVADGERRILLTGDARSDRFLEVLGDGPHHYDIVKIPHHGSDRNVDEAFFRSVIAEAYVFSGDGKHGNPERETIAMLLDHRPGESTPKLVFTYPVADIDKKRKQEWETKQARGAQRGEPVTPWDDDTMALATLLEAHAGEFTLVEPAEAGDLLPLL